LPCFESCLKCKGQNNEDKRYVELIGVTKRESLKKRLHPKALGNKGPSRPEKKKKKTFLLL
jgi:hypothetical protein